ncbi:MAG: hypothetical protein K0R99_4582 [Microbacterium sp.]|jgi:GNAT superfamily N-acetyltransferase|uniref:GNAT family N-acetyltransferase n=1 Tax=Microbacterium sp. TaxID=51671 RepID=UPI00261E1963|nr:GNAT family N-acetyltransferase [Microbacterium sp.]MDF2563136.1 hypothetical protein [Microbacterium sp.]
MNGPWSIHIPAAADAARIARVHTDSWRETYSDVLDGRFFSDEAYARRLDFWTRYLAADPVPGRLAVVRHNGQILGFANAGAATGPDAEHGFPAARPLHLFSIYLLSAAHGTGSGRALLDAVLAHEPAQLWVLRGNDRAIAFYARNGFVLDGAEYTDSSDPNLVELRMVR